MNLIKWTNMTATTTKMIYFRQKMNIVLTAKPHIHSKTITPKMTDHQPWASSTRTIWQRLNLPKDHTKVVLNTAKEYQTHMPVIEIIDSVRSINSRIPTIVIWFNQKLSKIEKIWVKIQNHKDRDLKMKIHKRKALNQNHQVQHFLRNKVTPQQDKWYQKCQKISTKCFLKMIFQTKRWKMLKLLRNSIRAKVSSTNLSKGTFSEKIIMCRWFTLTRNIMKMKGLPSKTIYHQTFLRMKMSQKSKKKQ